MRKKIVAGNWKMNLNSAEARDLVRSIEAQMVNLNEVELLVFPSFIYLAELISNAEQLHVGAQNFYPADSGAFTGEVSITQLKAIGVQQVLVGHSERRNLFHEDNAYIKQKVDEAIKHGMTVFFCCGEALDVRLKGEEEAFILEQLKAALWHLTADQLKQIVIAYEPVWAIGTGQTATVEQAEAMHAFIRSSLSNQFGSDVSNALSILYGGSCNAANAAELFACPNVDGGLIGGASLNADTFLLIANAF